MMRRLRRTSLVASPAAEMVLASVAIQAVNAATGIALARSLGPAVRGELALLLVFSWFATVTASAGMFEATTYFGAGHSGDSKRLVATVAGIAGIQAIVFLPLAYLVARYLFRNYSPAHEREALLFLGYIPLNLAVNYALALIRGFGHLRAFNLVRCLWSLGSGVPIILLGFGGVLSFSDPLTAYVCAATGALLLAGFMLRGEVGALRVDWRLARQMLVFGVKSFPGSLSSVLNERADQLFVGLFLTSTALGLYAAASSLANLTIIVGQSVALYALPELARIESDGRRRRRATQILRRTVLASGVVAVGGMLTAEWLLNHVFGREFASALLPTEILFVASVILSSNRALAASHRADNRPGVVGVAEGLALAVTVVALAVLVPTAGITGAALASVAAYGTSAAWMIRARRQVARRWTEEAGTSPSAASNLAS